MAATNDTIDGLLAEFRGYAAGMPDSYHVTMSWADFRKMLDRLEAAHRRELSKNTSKNGADFGQLGDAAKLRDALELCMDEMCSRCRDLAAARSNLLPCLQGCEPVRKAKAALAAPPRNCENYATVDEAMYDFGDEALIEEWNALKAGKDRDMLAVELFVFTRWLFATATEKEGGAK